MEASGRCALTPHFRIDPHDSMKGKTMLLALVMLLGIAGWQYRKGSKTIDPRQSDAAEAFLVAGFSFGIALSIVVALLRVHI